MARVSVRYLLLGGGPAATAAAQAVRQRDPTSSMLLVSDEPHRPYDRCGLSKEVLRGDVSLTDLELLPSNAFAQSGITLRLGRRAVSLDASQRLVTLDDKNEISFDKLLIATGLRAKPLHIPGEEFQNVLPLRRREDCDFALQMLAKPLTRRVTVVGGGLLGVEAAASLAKRGVSVDLLCSRPHLWPNLARTHAAEFVHRHLESLGVTVHTRTRATRILGRAMADRVETSSRRTIPTDLVLACAGIELPRELYKNTTIQLDAGALVDRYGKTSVPNIFAAGDVAEIFDDRFGRHRLFPFWDRAVASGRAVGENMTGGRSPIPLMSRFTTLVGDVECTSTGDASLIDRVQLKSASPDAFAEIGIASDGRVCHVLQTGLDREQATFDRWIDERVNHRAIAS